MTYTDDVTCTFSVVLLPIYMNDVVLLFLFLFRKRNFLGPVIRSYGEVLPLHQGCRGGTVVKVLCYKSEGRWFDPSWCQWNFSLT